MKTMMFFVSVMLWIKVLKFGLQNPVIKLNRMLSE